MAIKRAAAKKAAARKLPGKARKIDIQLFGLLLPLNQALDHVRRNKGARRGNLTLPPVLELPFQADESSYSGLRKEDRNHRWLAGSPDGRKHEGRMVHGAGAAQ